jgi:ubiquinone/menaquinone biosynthesis C-methylase UbiE
VGGGASRLVDHLVARGVLCVTVLDVSGVVISRARERLPHAPVSWIQADVTADWTLPPVDLWHDRATFHFLTDREDRRRYADALRRTVKPGGQAIIATFSLEGPTRCSGLPVVRYSVETLAAELGAAFCLIESASEQHPTPGGTTQSFIYTRFAFRGTR